MPARLLLLVVVSIVLTFISLGKLRDGWSFSQGGGSPLLSSAAQVGCSTLRMSSSENFACIWDAP